MAAGVAAAVGLGWQQVAQVVGAAAAVAAGGYGWRSVPLDCKKTVHSDEDCSFPVIRGGGMQPVHRQGKAWSWAEKGTQLHG